MAPSSPICRLGRVESQLQLHCTYESTTKSTTNTFPFGRCLHFLSWFLPWFFHHHQQLHFGLHYMLFNNYISVPAFFSFLSMRSPLVGKNAVPVMNPTSFQSRYDIAKGWLACTQAGSSIAHVSLFGESLIMASLLSEDGSSLSLSKYTY